MKKENIEIVKLLLTNNKIDVNILNVIYIYLMKYDFFFNEIQKSCNLIQIKLK